MYAQVPSWQDPYYFVDLTAKRHERFQDRILSICKDRFGFMWFGTDRFLRRYDGVDFRTYHHNPDDPTGPSSITPAPVRVIFEDKEGRLWVGTNGGLNMIERESDKITQYLIEDGLPANNIWTIYQDQSGIIWLGTPGGLARYKDGAFQAGGAEAGLDKIAVTVLKDDGEGGMLIGTREHGLFRYHESRGFRRIPVEGIDDIRDLVVGALPGIWIGTGNGLMCLEGETLTRFFDVRSPEVAPGKTINELLFDNLGHLWIGSNSHLCKFDGKRFESVLESDAGQENNSTQINRIYLDSDGLLWVATNKPQLLLLDSHSQYADIMPLEQSRNVMVDSRGIMWIGTNNGLFRVGPQTRRVEKTVTEGFFRFVGEDRDGNLYASFNKAVYRLDPETGKLGEEPLSEERWHWSFLADPNGFVWFGTEQGLIRYDVENAERTEYRAGRGKQALSLDVVTSLAWEEEGLWIGTFGQGLDYLDFKSGEIRHFNQENSNLIAKAVVDLAGDHLGRLWIGSAGSGLAMLEPGSDQFQSYTTNRGFPDNTVVAIQPDGNGLIWANTGSGLVRLDPAEDSWTLFSMVDGIHIGPAHTASSFGPDENGYLYFGGAAGLVRFLPDDFQPPEPAPLVFTRFLKGGREVSRQLMPGDEVVLEPDVRSFAFEVSMMDFRFPELNHVGYKREDLEVDWVFSTDKATISYNNYLPYGGTGVLQLKGIDGNAGERDAALTIRVKTPMWVRLLPIWAPLLVLTITGLIYMVIAARERRKRRALIEKARIAEEHRQLAEERAHVAEQARAVEESERRLQEERGAIAREYLERLSTEIANDLHDGPLSELSGIGFRIEAIGHELGDSKTAGVLQRLSSEELDRVCQDLRNICGDLLSPDFAYGLETELDSYADVMEGRHSGLSIHRVFEFEENRLAPEQKAMLFRICRTLLKNVGKHAHADRATLSLQTDDDAVNLTVMDNGRGFQVPPDWETFKRNKHYGMYMVSYFAESMGGSLKVVSTPGKGTTVTVTTPIQTMKGQTI
ncbi:MAG: two-component regulator propeller domain-containing protein [Acidobacteriota bacterium]|nr:two-component regulator propeller domain-containing protein [Acidobacteriota bacterium]